MTSELDKWGEIHEKVITITEFLDFVYTKQITLCSLSDKSEIFYPTTESPLDIIYEYFNIDKVKLEKERQLLLESLP